MVSVYNRLAHPYLKSVQTLVRQLFICGTVSYETSQDVLHLGLEYLIGTAGKSFQFNSGVSE